MRRRELLWILGGGLVAGAIGCDAEPVPGEDDPDARPPDPEPTGDAPAASVDACAPATVTMHDTYAQALYLDNSLGPLTGIVEVEYVVAGVAVTLDFWHGHGGTPHRFTLGPEHFAALRRGERVTLGTTTVEGHAHTLFVDPLDETYRVPGAPDVEVPLGTCA